MSVRKSRDMQLIKEDEFGDFRHFLKTNGLFRHTFNTFPTVIESVYFR